MWAFLSSSLRRWLLFAVVAPGVLLLLRTVRIQWERRVGPSTATRLLAGLETVAARLIGIGRFTGDAATPAAGRVRGTPNPACTQELITVDFRSSVTAQAA
jgi:hypothetical protein